MGEGTFSNNDNILHVLKTSLHNYVLLDEWKQIGHNLCEDSELILDRRQQVFSMTMGIFPERKLIAFKQIIDGQVL